MLRVRQAATGLFLADVALFLLAAAFNDHSSTSVDGILWWLAIAVFVLIIVFGLGLLVQFLWTRWTRRSLPRRPRARRGA